MELIDKAAVIVEIEKRKDIYKRHRLCSRKDEYDEILSFLDTLEVKEVDSTDAFIEKACEYMRNHIDRRLTIYHEQTWKKRDEFIEDFKNDMEVCK